MDGNSENFGNTNPKDSKAESNVSEAIKNKTNTPTKKPTKDQQTPRKTPAFKDLKPFLFKPNLSFIFSVVNSQNYLQISDIKIQKLYFFQITEIWNGFERVTGAKKKNPQVQLLHLASGWIAEKEISQLSVGYLYSSTIYSWG